jgi:hypothetical protein
VDDEDDVDDEDNVDEEDGEDEENDEEWWARRVSGLPSSTHYGYWQTLQINVRIAGSKLFMISHKTIEQYD